MGGHIIGFYIPSILSVMDLFANDIPNRKETFFKVLQFCREFKHMVNEKADSKSSSVPPPVKEPDSTEIFG